MRTRVGGRRIDPRSFESAVEALVEDLRRRYYSASLRGHVADALARFFDHLREKRIRDLRSVREEHVTAYARDLARATSARGKAYSISTQRWNLQAVKRFFAFLAEKDVLLQNPALDLALPHWRRLPRALLNQEQARRLVAHPSPFTLRGKRNRAILELLYGTGIRVSECERLDVRDLDLAQGHVFIRDGKGRKDRVVPVVGRAVDALDRYLHEVRPELLKDPREPALFLTRCRWRTGSGPLWRSGVGQTVGSPLDGRRRSSPGRRPGRVSLARRGRLASGRCRGVPEDARAFHE